MILSDQNIHVNDKALRLSFSRNLYNTRSSSYNIMHTYVCVPLFGHTFGTCESVFSHKKVFVGN